jgi:hypothetical protein
MLRMVPLPLRRRIKPRLRSWAGMGKAARASESRQMSAILMIIVFIAFIGLMNRLDFGRID